MRWFLTVFATIALAVAAAVWAASAQEVKYANTLDAEAARQGVSVVPCPPDMKDCSGNLVPKIINGHPADVGKFPWVVSIGGSKAESFRGHQCGGTLISDRYILSAAHCFTDTAKPEDFHVQMGTVKLTGYIDKAAIKSILIEKNFDRTTNAADVALLELAQPVLEGPTISWALVQDQQSFNNSGHESSGQRVEYTLTGFGYIMSGNYPVQLQYSNDIPSLTSVECRDLKVWGERIFEDGLPSDVICAGDTSSVDGSDACKGDSGGGLILPLGEGKGLVAGVVSRGALPDGSLDCTQQPLRVGVYTRVSAYAAEIADCLHGTDTCPFVPPGQQRRAPQN
jgi:secreted trypsin-like serine protease